jgi:hypothetical protein
VVQLCAGKGWDAQSTSASPPPAFSPSVAATPASAAVCRALQASAIRFVVLLWGEASSKATSALGQRLLSFDAVLARGSGRTFHPPQDLCGSDLATLVYTSGTTGQPKVLQYCIAVSYCAVLYFTLCCAGLCRISPPSSRWLACMRACMLLLGQIAGVPKHSASSCAFFLLCTAQGTHVLAPNAAVCAAAAGCDADPLQPAVPSEPPGQLPACGCGGPHAEPAATLAHLREGLRVRPPSLLPAACTCTSLPPLVQPAAGAAGLLVLCQPPAVLQPAGLISLLVRRAQRAGTGFHMLPLCFPSPHVFDLHCHPSPCHVPLPLPLPSPLLPSIHPY